MTNYREILRLSSLQYSQRTIESMAHCSRHTVRDVLGYTGALKAPVRCFGNHLSEKRKSLFQTDN